jgi:hypothetical protein
MLVFVFTTTAVHNCQPNAAHLHQELIGAHQVGWGIITLLMEEAVRTHRSV